MDFNEPPSPDYKELTIKLSHKEVNDFRLYNIFPKEDKKQQKQSKSEHKVSGSKMDKNNSEPKRNQIFDGDVYGM